MTNKAIKLIRPLVLVHGLWDTPTLFRSFINCLGADEFNLFTPNLPHKLGRVSIVQLANELNRQIDSRFERTTSIDILGFSMGGLISRVWLQDLGGTFRTKRFYSVGSPHLGTLTAQPVPSCLFKAISEMKIGSHLISRLNNEKHGLKGLECFSFYTNWDVMVFPGWSGKLPYGKAFALPVLTHKELVTNRMAIEMITRLIIN